MGRGRELYWGRRFDAAPENREYISGNGGLVADPWHHYWVALAGVGLVCEL